MTYLTKVTQLVLEPGFEHRQSGSRGCVLNHYTIIVLMIMVVMSSCLWSTYNGPNLVYSFSYHKFPQYCLSQY